MKLVNNHIDSINVAILSDSFVNDSVASHEYDNMYKDFRFITEKSGQFEGAKMREVTFVSAGWNFVILLAVMVLMVLNKFMSQNKFVSVMTMPFQHSANDRMSRDNHSFFNIKSIMMVASFIMLLSLMVQKFYVIYGKNYILHDNFGFYLDIVTAVAAVFVLDYLLIAFLAWLFKTEALLLVHVSLHVSVMTACSVVLAPLVMILLFYPYKFLFILLLSVVVLFFLARFAKFFIEIRMFSKLNFVNIFLYLCTVEILPVLVISKMIVDAI